MEKERISKYGLLKVLAITFLIFAVLTWIIPAGSYNGTTFVESETAPIGLYGIFINPAYSFGIFVQYVVLFLVIGGFYGILNETGVYSKMLEGIANKFEKRKKLFLVITIILFALLSSLVGSQVAVFVFVPFAIALLMMLGYDKITSLAATVGAILVGIIGSTYGTSVTFKSFFGMDANNGIVYRLIFFALITTLYTLFILSKNKCSKIEEKVEEKPKRGRKKKEEVAKLEKQEEVKKIDIPLYEKKEESKNVIPLIIIFSLLTIVILAGMFNWYYTFGIEFFGNIYDSIMNFKISEIPVFAKIFGSLPEIGSFGNYDLVAVLLIASVVIGWVYGNKIDTFIDAFIKGAKEMLLPSLYVMFASVIFAVMVNTNGNISYTITNFLIGIVDKFNIIIVSLVGLIGSFFYNDFPYLVNSVYGAVSNYDVVLYPAMTMILNATYGIAMLILPVSITLIAGLKYMDISYKDWVKYIWKFLVAVLAILIIFSLIILAIIK